MSPQTSRRFRTARRIQAAAVALASRHGLANVTTEAIAQKAEISTRTFFNHYPYKEAAIMGPRPTILRMPRNVLPRARDG